MNTTIAGSSPVPDSPCPTPSSGQSCPPPLPNSVNPPPLQNPPYFAPPDDGPVSPRLIPLWVQRRYPWLKHAARNPLGLYMSGFMGMDWGRKVRPSLRPPLRALPYFMMLIMPLACCSFLIVPLALPMLRYYVFEQWWREAARSGKLLDLYLGLTAEEVVEGIAGGRLLGSHRGHLTWALTFALLLGLYGVSMILFRDIRLWKASAEAAPDQSQHAFFLVATAILQLLHTLIVYLAIQFVIAFDTFYTTLDSIAHSAERATVPSVFHSFSSRVGDALKAWGDGFLRFGVPIVAYYGFGIVSNLAVFSVFGVSAMAARQGAANVHQLQGGWLLGMTAFRSVANIIGLGLFVFIYMLMMRNPKIRAAHAKAIASVRAHLPAIIEANPPAGN